ncbi:efflux RND transporter periplasmic adaptor subunit [Elioraea sp.]|uniref:efflux RND transporter periplasmic adaptor subunit n=1 Tax=Elioraea sp. TaxID=2185103 RepID=UPI0025BCE9E6|nr:efflux RND transporter periplasmic adaptor subunit [Elioraea sp.]
MHDHGEPIDRMSLRSLVVIACLAAGGAIAVASVRDEPARPLRVAVADRGTIVASVSATGTLNPRRTVDVSSQLSGQVREVLVDYNSRVEAGQPVAQLEDSHLVARLGAAVAEEQAARANLILAESQRTRAIAQVAAADAVHDRALANARARDAAERDATAELARRRALRDRGVGAANDAERAGFAAERAVAEAAAADADTASAVALAASAAADLQVAEAAIAAATATVAQRVAQRRQVEVDIERSVIRSPIAGVVVNRQVNVGQTVAASLAAPTLFLIAGDLTEMEVWATVDEADIGRVREGQVVRFSVGAWPDETFEGRVRTVRLAATVTQNVVTYTVVVTARNEDGRLMPGMTATMRIETDRRGDVLRVPAAALRFRPAIDGPAQPLPPGVGLVHVQGEGGRLTAVRVTTGAADARYTEIASAEPAGVLEPGVPVVIGVATEGPARRSSGLRLGF